MDLFKLDKYDKYFIAFILVVITLFNVGQCFAVEEEQVDFEIVQSLWSTENQNYFTSNSDIRQGYVQLEKGYVYTFYNNGSSYSSFVFCNNVPALNVVYYDYTTVSGNNTYSFIVNEDFEYFVFSLNNPNTNRYLTRHKIESMSGTVDSLAENVGINQLWGVFEGGVDFVGVIVLVAFGLFLVFLLIKKLSKGKADF